MILKLLARLFSIWMDFAWILLLTQALKKSSSRGKSFNKINQDLHNPHGMKTRDLLAVTTKFGHQDSTRFQPTSLNQEMRKYDIIFIKISLSNISMCPYIHTHRMC